LLDGKKNLHNIQLAWLKYFEGITPNKNLQNIQLAWHKYFEGITQKQDLESGIFDYFALALSIFYNKIGLTKLS